MPAKTAGGSQRASYSQLPEGWGERSSADAVSQPQGQLPASASQH